MDWRPYSSDPRLSAFRIVEAPPAFGLVRDGYEAHAGRLGLSGPPTGAVGRVSGGRESHPVVGLPGGERVVVRRYRRGGMLRHLNRDRYFVGHRALEELRATEHARAAGVRVPLAIAAMERRGPVGYTATFATGLIPDARELARWLEGAQNAEEALRDAGAQVSAMHAGGVSHPDLNLRNFLVAAEQGVPAVYLLDFDRARLHPGPVDARRRAADLQRLARSARKLGAPISRGGWAALREGYGADWPRGLSLG